MKRKRHKHITIDPDTWAALERIRRRLGLRSIAETVRYLVKNAEEAEGDG